MTYHQYAHLRSGLVLGVRSSDKESFNLHQRRVENSEWGYVTKNVTRTYVVLDDEDGLRVVT